MPAQPTFEQIVLDHQHMVFRTLARLTGPSLQQSHLEDLAQDVFLRLFRALPNFRGEAQLSTYLYRIAINVANDELNRRRRGDLLDRRHVSLSDDDANWEDRLPHPSATPAEQLQHDEFAALVEEHLQRLSPVERSVLVLYHQEEQTYDQIAHTLVLPLNTVRTHLHRARKKLREALQAEALASKRITA